MSVLCSLRAIDGKSRLALTSTLFYVKFRRISSCPPIVFTLYARFPLIRAHFFPWFFARIHQSAAPVMTFSHFRVQFVCFSSTSVFSVRLSFLPNSLLMRRRICLKELHSFRNEIWWWWKSLVFCCSVLYLRTDFPKTSEVFTYSFPYYVRAQSWNKLVHVAHPVRDRENERCSVSAELWVLDEDGNDDELIVPSSFEAFESRGHVNRRIMPKTVICSAHFTPSHESLFFRLSIRWF